MLIFYRILCIHILIVAFSSCSNSSFSGESATDKKNANPRGRSVDSFDKSDTEKDSDIDARDSQVGRDSDLDDIELDDDTVQTIEISSSEDILEACRSRSTKTYRQTFNYAASLHDCPMGQNGNLSQIVGSRLQARVEITKDFDLPENAILCELILDFPSQNFHYDDQAFLLLNEYFIFATQLAPDAAPKNGELLLYDWDRIKGMPWTPGLHRPVCIGQDAGGVCTLPKSDETGIIDIDIPESVSAELSLALLRAARLEFTLIGAGEGTPGTDCHIKAPLNFEVRAKYILR